MTKEQIIKWLENIMTSEKENPFCCDEMIATFSIDAQLKAADLLASISGWKTQCCMKGIGSNKDKGPR